MEESHQVENIHNRVEQGSLAVVDNHTVEELHLAVEQTALDILAVAVEMLAEEEDIQDIVGKLHTVDIQDTSHKMSCRQQSTVHCMSTCIVCSTKVL